MTQRSRNILIIVILAIVIAGGGVGIYLFSRQVPTALVSPDLLVTDVEGQSGVLEQSVFNAAFPGDENIDWLGNCSYQLDTSRAGWDVQKPSSLQVPFTCEISDTSTDHTLEVRSYDLRAYVYELPPNEACLDQASRNQFSEWPKLPDDQSYHDLGLLTQWIAGWAPPAPAGSTCADLGSRTNIQEPGWPGSPDNVQTIDIPAGQTQVQFSSTHSFDQCDWYQWDVLLLDPATQDAEFGAGFARRSFGNAAQCGIVTPTEEASLEVRAYVDDNRDDEYGPATSEGAPFFEKQIKITDNITGQEIDYSAEQCTGGPDNQLGGAGRKLCPSLIGGRTYTVELLDLLPNTVGPIQEPHNTNGENPVQITLAGDPTVDIVDFGFDPAVAEGEGSLLVRVYEEQGPPFDDEYTENAGEGAVFASTPVTITDAAGTRINPVSPPNADCPAVTGGAGRINCLNLQPGQYTVDVDPDITTHDGPDPEAHNPLGEDPYVVTVTAGQQAIADFQYLPRIVSPGSVDCSLTALPKQGSVPLSVNFTATVTPSSVQVQSFDWTFGDGQTTQTPGTQNTTQHTYQQAGSYDPSVTVTTAAGGVATCTTPVLAGQVQPTGITCSLTANPNSGISPLDTILAVAVNPATTDINSVEYDFGDGTPPVTTSQVTQPHTYTGFNVYTAQATVSDNTGQVASCSTTVTVQQVPQGELCRIEVVDFLDSDRDGTQDAGFVGYVEPGMDGALITIQSPSGAPISLTSAPVPGQINRYGEAHFVDIPCDTYTVTIDESSRVIVGGTTQQHVLNQMDRTTPASNSTQVTVGGAQTGVRVEFGYYPRDIVAFLCEIDKSVADTTAGDEGTPDDPKVSNSSPGETLTYTINWDCSGFPETGPLSQTIGFTITDDFYDPLLTLVPGSITGGGVYNQSQGIITWNIVGAPNVDQGSVSFQATIESNLAPGTYVLPNYVIAVTNNGGILGQDQTLTNVVVPEGVDVPDVEVIKYAQDLNGGEVVPGDILQYYVVVWNNGNTPLNDVAVTENIQPNVNGFRVVTIPAGATDQSTPTGGSNGTGYLNVTGIDLPNRGDVATITYQVTVNAGVPDGTQLVNFVTATSESDEDTDDETVVVGEVLPSPPVAPSAGPGPTAGVTSGQPAVPPLLGPRAYVPPLTSAEPTPAPETGVSAVMWILLLSLITAFGTAGYVVIRQKNKLLQD